MKKKLPKQPKPRKMPKKPKASASFEVWKNYEHRVHATHKMNNERQSEWKKKIAKIHSEEKQRQALINKFKR